MSRKIPQFDVVWMDQSHATLFSVWDDLIETKPMSARVPEDREPEWAGLVAVPPASDLFLTVVRTLTVDEAESILIVGPGVAKYHFYAYLREQHPRLARKVASCDAVDYPSESQIAAVAKRVRAQA